MAYAQNSPSCAPLIKLSLANEHSLVNGNKLPTQDIVIRILFRRKKMMFKKKFLILCCVEVEIKKNNIQVCKDNFPLR